MSIEKLYRLEVVFEHPDQGEDDWTRREALEESLERMLLTLPIGATLNSGTPASHPYVEAYFPTLSAARRAEQRITRVIRSFSGKVIEV